jgi:hypothetical protein
LAVHLLQSQGCLSQGQKHSPQTAAPCWTESLPNPALAAPPEPRQWLDRLFPWRLPYWAGDLDRFRREPERAGPGSAHRRAAGWCLGRPEPSPYPAGLQELPDPRSGLGSGSGRRPHSAVGDQREQHCQVPGQWGCPGRKECPIATKNLLEVQRRPLPPKGWWMPHCPVQKVGFQDQPSLPWEMLPLLLLALGLSPAPPPYLQ